MLPLVWMTQLEICPGRDNYVEAEKHNPSVPEVTQYLPATVPMFLLVRVSNYFSFSHFIYFQVMIRLENSVAASPLKIQETRAEPIHFLKII